ncbi:MAG: ATP-grasp domain-containing protein [Firmicutes bacterium]|nr:ATP-grasp domain-containing protein [Bacillota bacterium]
MLLLPPSIQLICPDQFSRLIYRGADYAAFSYLSKKIKESVLSNAKVIGEQLRRYEYLGVAGIDFLYSNGTLYFLEINPRFQASTALLNKALLTQGLPSVQKLNLDAFQTVESSFKIVDILVPYSNFCYDSNDVVSKHMLKCCENNALIELDLDGYIGGISDVDAYQFRVNFPYNISNANPSGSVDIHNNIVGSPSIPQITYRKIIQIKFELLNQGVIITPDALEYINKTGQIRSAVFDSIDITIFNNLRVNCPYKTKLSEFSPYSIDLADGVLLLKRYEQTISIVHIDLIDALSNCKTSNDVKYHNIATLATDRVRINHTSVCHFKANACGCTFCNLPEHNGSYSFYDICQVIDNYLEYCDFRHFLIGGGSSGQGYAEVEHIIKIAKYIKQKCDKPVYVMCLPPEDPRLIELLYDTGIDEIAFNIEVFDREIAKKIMPGKGLIPLQQYYNSLNKGVNLWGRNGRVKSLVIVGLETQESLMQGIQTLCTMGVQPVLSAFRPLKNTPLENSIPPPTNTLIDIYTQAEKLCKNESLFLGPSCFECQNNTVSFHPDHPMYSRISDFQQ